MRERFDFEIDEEPIRRPRSRLNILDLFTVLVLLAAGAMAAFMAYVFFFPHTSLNPLKPRIPTPFDFPTATITPLQLEATWTPTLVLTTDTPTLAPTITAHAVAHVDLTGASDQDSPGHCHAARALWSHHYGH